MTSEEIAQRIMDKFHKVTKEDGDTKDPNGHAPGRKPKLIFEMSNKPLENSAKVLDFVELTKKQVLEVIAICTNDPDEENKEEIADLIVKDHVNEEQPLFLSALCEYVTAK